MHLDSLTLEAGRTDAEKLDVAITYLTESHISVHGGYPYDWQMMGITFDKLVVAALAEDRLRTEVAVYQVRDLVRWHDRAFLYADREKCDGPRALAATMPAALPAWSASRPAVSSRRHFWPTTRHKAHVESLARNLGLAPDVAAKKLRDVWEWAAANESPDGRVKLPADAVDCVAGSWNFSGAMLFAKPRLLTIDDELGMLFLDRPTMEGVNRAK